VASNGYVKLWRRLQHHHLWQERRVFSKAEAFLDCLMEARHAASVVDWHGVRVRVPRGSFLTTTARLEERWQWSRKAVRYFLSGKYGLSVSSVTNVALGANEGYKVRAKLGTIVSVDGYERWQGGGPSEGPTLGPTEGTTEQEEKKEASWASYPQAVDNPEKRIHEVAAVYQVFRQASGNLTRPPSEADKRVISEAIEAFDGDWRAVAGTVRDVCLKAVKAKSKPGTVSYCRPALDEKARERREAAEFSNPRVQAMVDEVAAKVGATRPDLPASVRTPDLTPEERAALERLRESVKR